MTKKEISELIKEVVKELLHTDIIMYPAGSVRQEEAKKIGKTCEYILIDNKPEFIDMQDYRKSLLELISKLIDFYKEVE
ncbi:MAG: hypothetical protein II393_01690 [Cytophagales bacterium]|nr:hypothetical protein [Cytophagales bacterium]